MLRTSVLLCCLFASLPSCGRTLWSPPDPNTLSDALGAHVDAAMRDGAVPGAVVLVQTPRGVWVKASGTADGTAPVTRAHRFALRDISAAFIVTLVLRMVDEQRLSLEEPIAQWVDGVPNGETLRLSHLASMRSGLVDYTETAGFAAFVAADPLRQASAFELLQFAFAEPPRSEPGAAFHYSRTNVLLLAEVVSKELGRPWQDNLEAAIVAPLRLSDTEAPLGAQVLEPYARGFARDASGADIEQRFSFDLFGAAAGLIASVDDLTGFGRALAEGTLVSPGMYAIALGGSQLDGQGYDTYGAGLGTIDGFIGHLGAGYGYQSAVFHEAATDVTITVLLNASNVDNLQARLVRSLITTLGWTGRSSP